MSLSAEISTNRVPVIVGVVYLPKSANYTVIDIFESILMQLSNSNLECNIMGDCNRIFLNDDDPTVFNFCNLVSSYSFYILHTL